jgi:hypothetical protein
LIKATAAVLTLNKPLIAAVAIERTRTRTTLFVGVKSENKLPHGRQFQAWGESS